MKIAIFTEDEYGIDFLRSIIKRLREEGYVKSHIESVKTYTPSQIRKCHRKFGKKVKSVVRDADRIIIVIDKENDIKYDEENQIWRHLKDLKETDKKKIVVIATEPCIEEWICISLGLSFDKSGIKIDQKPDRVLERERKYKKKNLPKFALELNFEKLIKESKSFLKFLEALRN